MTKTLHLGRERIALIGAGNPVTTEPSVPEDLQQLRRSDEQVFSRNLESKRVGDSCDDVEADTNVSGVEDRSIAYTGVARIRKILWAKLAWGKRNLLEKNQGGTEPLVNPCVPPICKYLAC